MKINNRSIQILSKVNASLYSEFSLKDRINNKSNKLSKKIFKDKIYLSPNWREDQSVNA